MTVKVKDQKKSGITGYKVKYRVAGTSKWKTKKFPLKKSAAAKKGQLTVKGLKAGKRYQVRVRARGDGGWGAWSKTVTSKKIKK